MDGRIRVWHPLPKFCDVQGKIQTHYDSRFFILLIIQLTVARQRFLIGLTLLCCISFLVNRIGIRPDFCAFKYGSFIQSISVRA